MILKIINKLSLFATSVKVFFVLCFVFASSYVAAPVFKKYCTTNNFGGFPTITKNVTKKIDDVKEINSFRDYEKDLNSSCKENKKVAMSHLSSNDQLSKTKEFLKFRSALEMLFYNNYEMLNTEAGAVPVKKTFEKSDLKNVHYMNANGNNERRVAIARVNNINNNNRGRRVPISEELANPLNRPNNINKSIEEELISDDSNRVALYNPWKKDKDTILGITKHVSYYLRINRNKIDNFRILFIRDIGRRLRSGQGFSNTNFKEHWINEFKKILYLHEELSIIPDNFIQSVKSKKSSNKDKDVTVTFAGSSSGHILNIGLPVPNKCSVRPGTPVMSFYHINNPLDKKITVLATFNVLPESSSEYFTKVECFCFEEFELGPNETIELPVLFFIEEDILDNKLFKDTKNLVLSYDFIITGT